jgi:vanadium-dependent haloperoxidase-like protein
MVDGPNSEQPPGHWALFAQFVSARDHHTIDDDVKMFFVLSNAIFDAGIAAWDAKRTYDSVRPVTAIPLLFRGTTIRTWGGPGKGTVEMDGSQWIPYQAVTFPTPPFPDYVSGHSTYSAAAAWPGRFRGLPGSGKAATPSSGGDPAQGFIELCAAVATDRTKHISSEALRVYARKHVPAVSDVAAHKSNVGLLVDLILECVEAELSVFRWELCRGTQSETLGRCRAKKRQSGRPPASSAILNWIAPVLNCDAMIAC